MQKYGLHGSLKAVVGKRDALAEILCEASGLMSQAKGCHLYLVSLDTSDDQTIWVTEVWEEQADHDEALKAETVRTLIGKALPLLEGQPQKGQTLSVIGGL